MPPSSRAVDPVRATPHVGDRVLRARAQVGADVPAWVFALELGISLAGIALIFTVLLRFGLLAMIVTIYTFLAIEGFPLTTDLSRPYAGTAFLLLAGLTALSLSGFYASRGGESLFGRPLLD